MSKSRYPVAVPASRPYHHGDLRRELLLAAVGLIEEVGPSALSLRELARRVGVSHAAPAHHFGDKAGVLTAVAVEGFDRLRDELEAPADFMEVGVAYVRFALENRAHFSVMFNVDLYHADDPALLEARRRAGEALNRGAAAAAGASLDVNALAAWSLVHGFATLTLGGNFPPRVQQDPEAALRSIAALLFSKPSGPGVGARESGRHGGQ